jgi:hypothetical protein
MQKSVRKIRLTASRAGDGVLLVRRRRQLAVKLNAVKRKTSAPVLSLDLVVFPAMATTGRCRRSCLRVLAEN